VWDSKAQLEGMFDEFRLTHGCSRALRVIAIPPRACRSITRSRKYESRMPTVPEAAEDSHVSNANSLYLSLVSLQGMCSSMRLIAQQVARLTARFTT
jgi:hypothetical protein